MRGTIKGVGPYQGAERYFVLKKTKIKTGGRRAKVDKEGHLLHNALHCRYNACTVQTSRTRSRCSTCFQDTHSQNEALCCTMGRGTCPRRSCGTMSSCCTRGLHRILQIISTYARVRWHLEQGMSSSKYHRKRLSSFLREFS